MPDTRLTFKEMCAQFDVTPRTLRYYEYIELLQPDKIERSRFYDRVNEIEAAYNELRNRFALKKYNRSYKDLLKDYKEFPSESLKEQIDFLKDSYPQIITEPEPIK